MMETTTGLVIKGLREKYGYTQDKVAEYLGIKREMISFYENEGREIPLEVLEKLSDLFGVELEAFFVDNVDEALAEVVFAFRKDDFESDDMENMAAFGKIVKNYLKINNLYGSI
ncbi:MAG: helix-turn-helix transcriptional regulator [Flavobacterium sp.]|nr:helix-turn-helix transcriptional regulator [Flavobacterium sp.]